jgi:hypothetical protein
MTIESVKLSDIVKVNERISSKLIQIRSDKLKFIRNMK